MSIVVFMYSPSKNKIERRVVVGMDIVSLIAPFLNEKDCIAEFCGFVEELAKDKSFLTEVIFVDDGSTDNTSDIVTAYKFVNCHNIKLIQLSKNYGSHAALRAGIVHSSGDYTTSVAVDLQTPDDMVTVMYDNIIKGLDAVYIEKRSIRVKWISRLLSLTVSTLMRRFAVKNYGSGGINNIMFNKKIKEQLNNNIETNSSLVLQIIDMGFKSVTIPMDYKGRVAGKSKWTFSKKIKLFIDSFVAFSFAPIRLVSIIGILFSLIGFVFGARTIVIRLVYPYMPAGYATMVSLILIGFGITNISIGVIAEYLWRTLDAARGRPAFIVSNIEEIKK